MGSRPRRYRINLIVTLWTGLCFISLFALLPTLNANGQSEADAVHQYTYGQSATFTLNLDDATGFEDFMLYISASDINTTSHSGEQTGNSVSYNRDLRDQPLPPFSLVTYWWEYSGSNNAPTMTEKVTFQYVDNRFSWQSYSDRDIQVFWVTGEKSTVINATSIAWDTTNKVQHALQTTTTPSVDVYMYPSSRDLQSSLQLAGLDWISGASYPELGVILLSIPEGNQALSQIQRLLPHELTHKLLFDNYGSDGYQNLPAWLVEGLASTFEPSPDPTFAVALDEARTNSTLLHLENLCYPFPDSQPSILLSYAQSESITRYIQQKYGWSGIRNLLQLYAEEGVACTLGLEEILDLPISQFEREWRVWLETQNTQSSQDSKAGLFKLTPEFEAAIAVFIKDAARWLIVGAFLVLPFLIFSMQLIIKKKTPK